MGFSRQPFSLDALPLDDSWTLSTGEIRGAPALIRFNDGARAWLGHAEMPVRVGIAVPLHAPDGRGIPGPEEQAQLEYIEGVLVERVDTARVGRVVFVLTTGGTREFVSYVRSVAAADELVNHVGSTITTHEIQAYRADDPDWTFLRDIARSQRGQRVLASGKAGAVISRVVGWTLVGLAGLGTIATITLLGPAAFDLGSGADSSEVLASAFLVLLPLALLGIFAYVGMRFLQQAKSSTYQTHPADAHEVD